MSKKRRNTYSCFKRSKLNKKKVYNSYDIYDFPKFISTNRYAVISNCEPSWGCDCYSCMTYVKHKKSWKYYRKHQYRGK